MLFFVPTHTDRRLARTPWVNYTLVAFNLIVFVLTLSHLGIADLAQPLETTVQQAPSVGYWLWPEAPYLRLYQFISYQFLHASWEHLLFNMLFLYVFGNAVEDHLGPVGYLLFYLAGGVIAGLGHTLVSSNPVLGASGSVSAVTGAYLALFPLSNVTIFYWVVVFIGRFEVSSIILILFRVVQDAVFQFTNVGNTAYAAHLAGYAFGFFVGMGLLLTRLVPRESYDMLSLIEQKQRRSRFQRQVRQGYTPWDNPSPDAKPGDPIPADQAARPDEDDLQLMDRRAAISTAISNHNLDQAASLYTALLHDHPQQVLAQQAQLDIANQLMAQSEYASAAQSYELFLKHYPQYTQRPHIQLILGLIHARYLNNPDRARELLTTCRDQLAPDDQQLADTVLTEIN